MISDAVIVIGLLLNALLTSGVLYKLIGFAQEWGAMKKTLEHHDKSIEQLWVEAKR